MIKSMHVFAGAVGIALYAWFVWFKASAAEREPMELRMAVLWSFVIAAAVSVFALIRGFARGHTFSEIVLLDVDPGKLENSLVGAFTFVTLFLCISVHYLLGMLNRLTKQSSGRDETL